MLFFVVQGESRILLRALGFGPMYPCCKPHEPLHTYFWLSKYYRGCFQKSWYPQIIHFNRVLHYKPYILGTTIFGNIHICYISICTTVVSDHPHHAWWQTINGMGGNRVINQEKHGDDIFSFMRRWRAEASADLQPKRWDLSWDGEIFLVIYVWILWYWGC